MDYIHVKRLVQCYIGLYIFIGANCAIYLNNDVLHLNLYFSGLLI